jgi:hypothetical protein
MKKQLRQDLKNILEMFMPDEEKHYQLCSRAEKRTHILHSLRRVHKTLQPNKKEGFALSKSL